MPLAILTHIPARHGNNTTRRTSFSSTLSWRQIFSSPTSRREYNQYLSSRTALAGATEKFIRHHPAEITCGDLTAREFAMLAGISTSATMDEDDLSSTNSEGDLPSPKIWDQDFWLHPLTRTSSAATATATASSMTNNDDPCHHSNHHCNAPNIILRGRFQICVGEDTNNDTDMSSNFATSPSSALHVVEWKRKKSV